MSKIKLDWAMCLDCDWQGDRDECETELDYDDFNFNYYKYPICPNCGGGVELSSKEFDNVVSLEEYLKSEENHKPGL